MRMMIIIIIVIMYCSFLMFFCVWLLLLLWLLVVGCWLLLLVVGCWLLSSSPKHQDLHHAFPNAVGALSQRGRFHGWEKVHDAAVDVLSRGLFLPQGEGNQDTGGWVDGDSRAPY